jgi:cytochrome P450
MLGITSDNCDETVYEAPREFRLGRNNKSKHFAFGVGSHLCLGNHLTRMVGRVVLEEVLDHFAPGELQLVPDYAWVCVEHPLEYGPETLDVMVAATEGAQE